jgi:hypothetical protein
MLRHYPSDAELKAIWILSGTDVNHAARIITVHERTGYTLWDLKTKCGKIYTQYGGHLEKLPKGKCVSCITCSKGIQ